MEKIEWTRENRSKVILDGDCPICGERMESEIDYGGGCEAGYWSVKMNCCERDYQFYPSEDRFLFSDGDPVELIEIGDLDW